MLHIQNLSYIHSNKELLFHHITLTIPTQNKTALVGNNGSGKSTLLRIIAGQLQPSAGSVRTEAAPYYLPQLYGQFDEETIAGALGIEARLNALREILAGNATEERLALLNEDWTLEERCQQALQHWNLEGLDLQQPMKTLSGGQKTRVFLAGIAIHQPELILLDEPSNHLDLASRQKLYEFIASTTATLLVVSNDRTLLNLLQPVCELSPQGVSVYGGNYDFYAEQKNLEGQALLQKIRSGEKALRKAKDAERDNLARQQKLDARGKRKQEKAGLPTIAMKTFKNNAEKSTARIKEVHHEKV